MGVTQRIDAFQRRHRWVGLPLAVVYKFADDQGTYLAALLTYYGFLSLFPFLLIVVTALGAFLHDNEQLQRQVLHSALSEFPVIGDQIGQNIHSFQGNGVALTVGILGSLYGGLGIAQAAQYALNKIWAVPRHTRPDPFRSRVKGLLFLLVATVGLGASTGLSVAASESDVFGTRFGVQLRLGITVVSVALSALMLILASRMLTHRRIPVRRLWGSALGAAFVWQVLQWAGTYYVGHVLRGAGATYGMFGLVLGLIAWIYLGALVFVVAAEVSSVRTQRLWPRSLLTPFTDKVRLSWGDRRAYESYAVTETFKSFEDVNVHFRQHPPPPHPHPDHPDRPEGPEGPGGPKGPDGPEGDPPGGERP
ncbi:YihY/virulence factor BrkB family protein [Streptomyces sp. NPDC008313]|uniref:YihY/virulence factor BrkB family protein n=1 Tax=Streptomyces sp. NPDC008313 TaxID=3364826 RepID=UPI0036E1E6A6